MPAMPPIHCGKVASNVTHEVERPSACDRGYGARWQRARLRFLRDHPLCLSCYNEGKLEAAGVVDHITPHKGDQLLFWNVTNWQPLCKRCHDRKTASEQKLYSKPV